MRHQIDIPTSSPWAVGFALAQELVRNWDAQVQEYDVTPTGGSITIALPVHKADFRIARRRSWAARVSRTLVSSRDILRHSRDLCVDVERFLRAAKRSADDRASGLSSSAR